MTNTSSGYHNIYRPTTLDEVIGNEAAVNSLRGIIAKGKYPSAILFTGPASVGKTTMARAFINQVNGPENFNVNTSEENWGADRAIDDIRRIIGTSRLRPAQGAVRRFVLADEAHGLLGNNVAANALLKTLEEPSRSTTFILCSMERDKFAANQTGRAIATRCLNIELKTPTAEEMRKQAKRIIKGEGMKDFITSEILDAVVQSSSSSMRVLANNLELLSNLKAGKGKGELTVEEVATAMSNGSESDDKLAMDFLSAVYARKYVAAHRKVLDVQDSFGFINKCLWLNWFVLSMLVLKGERHPKVWGNANSWALLKFVQKAFGEENIEREVQLTILGEVQNGLTQLKTGAGAFAIDEKMALAAMAWPLIQTLKKVVK